MNWIAWFALAVGGAGLAGFLLAWWGMAMAYRREDKEDRS